MSEGAMTKEEFVQGMKTLREEAAAKEAAKKAKQREYNRRYAEKKKAEKAEAVTEAVADPEGVEPPRVVIYNGVTLAHDEAVMLSQYIRDTICHALDGDYYFNEGMIFTLVHLADRLGGMQ